MEALIAALGVAILVLAIVWMVAPGARYRLRRSISGWGLLLLIVIMMLAYGRAKG